MLKLIAAFTTAYVILTAMVVFINTEILRIGDPKFQGRGFEIYFPLELLFYAPFAITAIAAIWCAGVVGLTGASLAGVLLAIILVTMEVNWIIDPNWRKLVVTWIVMSIAFFFIARAWRAS